MLVKRMGLPWITVSNVQEAKRLYIDILGFEIHEENKEIGWLEVKRGDSVLGIWQASQGASDKPGQNAVLTFIVDDIMHAKKTLEQKGITVTSEITEIPHVFKVVSFVDVDGNKCQLYEFCK